MPSGMGDAFAVQDTGKVIRTGVIGEATAERPGRLMDEATRQDLTDTRVEEPQISLSLATQAANSIASSAEPDVVFESLVQRCAPLVCDAATATVSGLDGRVYATTWPKGGLNRRSQPDSVVTEFVAPAAGDYAGYRGLVSLRFARESEHGLLIAQLLVDRAVAVVEQGEELRRSRCGPPGDGGPARGCAHLRTGRSGWPSAS